MDFLPAPLQDYAEQHTAPEPELLKKIAAHTRDHIPKPRMLSGHLQGRILALVSRMLRPNVVLEIGTYTGYAALCLAEGLTHTGKVITLDINTDLKDLVTHFFQQSPYEKQMDYRLGDARTLIPRIHETLDLVFIDADKVNYALYFDLVIEKVRKGGVLVADNVLWSGKVVNEKEQDKDTKALRAFNKKVHEDKRVETLLLPVRDGLMFMRKRT